MDPGEAALLGALVSGGVVLIATAVGPLIGQELGRRRRVEEALCAFRMTQIDRTERALALQLLILEAMANRDVQRGRRLAGEAQDLGDGDLQLLGGLDPVRAFIDAVAPVAARLRYGLVGGTWSWITALDVSHAERQALTDAKMAIHTALDAQRERVLRGQKPILLRRDDVSEVFAAHEAVERFMDHWTGSGVRT